MVAKYMMEVKYVNKKEVMVATTISTQNITSVLLIFCKAAKDHTSAAA